MYDIVTELITLHKDLVKYTASLKTEEDIFTTIMDTQHIGHSEEKRIFIPTGPSPILMEAVMLIGDPTIPLWLKEMLKEEVADGEINQERYDAIIADYKKYKNMPPWARVEMDRCKLGWMSTEDQLIKDSYHDQANELRDRIANYALMSEEQRAQLDNLYALLLVAPNETVKVIYQKEIDEIFGISKVNPDFNNYIVHEEAIKMVEQAKLDEDADIMVATSQAYMKLLGFDIGYFGSNTNGIDGKWGSNTTRVTLMIEYFYGEDVSGMNDEELLGMLSHSYESGLDKNSIISVFKPEPTGLGYEADGRIAVDSRSIEPKRTISIHGYELHPDAATAWSFMVTNAWDQGIDIEFLKPTSGYRSISHQQTLWDKKIASLKEEYPSLSLSDIEAKAKRRVAKPGYSEHHTGYAVDLDMPYENKAKYNHLNWDTDTFEWLDENADKYGFINYQEEAWHWSYNPK